MKVILKKDLHSLGETGEIVDVKDGYARNYLLPYAFAERATDGALRDRERNLTRIQAKAEKVHNAALELAEIIKKIEKLQLQVKAGENGKLFGSITTRKLSEELKEKSGVEVDRKNISLNKPINLIGEYTMLMKLTSKVSVELPVIVSASEVIAETFLIDEEETETTAEVTEEVVEEVVEESTEA